MVQSVKPAPPLVKTLPGVTEFYFTDCIATDPEKTKAKKDIKAPKDISGVRRITQTFA